MLDYVTEVTPCELTPTQLRRVWYASAMVQTDAWPQTCALSGPSPFVHAENVGERHLKSAVQAYMVNQMVEEPSNLCKSKFRHLEHFSSGAVEALREAALSLFN